MLIPDLNNNNKKPEALTLVIIWTNSSIRYHKAHDFISMGCTEYKDTEKEKWLPWAQKAGEMG